MLQKKAWCFLSRFQTQRCVDADFQSFLAFREYAIRRNFAAAFTSEQGHSVWFQADSFLGHNILRCMSAYALKALASLDLNCYIACLYICSLTLAVKTNMQFTLAVLPPNCSRCDLSMPKIQNFSGGACPQTSLLVWRANSRQRITSNSSSTPCFTTTPLQKSWRRPWFKAKGVVSLPLYGACV